MSTITHKTASLRAALPLTGDLRVDEEAGVIYGASVMVIGPAQGHGFELDSTSLSQLVDAVNANGGSVKVRAKHPKVGEDGQLADDLFDVVGTVANLRVDGDRVRGDVTLDDYASVMPGLGDVRSYLLKRAAKHPERFGLSAVIDYEIEPVTANGVTRLMARIYGVDSVDLVGRGAATPDGLLSTKQPNAAAGDVSAATPSTTKPPALSGVAVKPATRQGKASLMEYDPKLLSALKALGLAEDATEEDAKAFFEAMTDEQKAACKAKLEATPEPEPAKLAAKRAAIITDEGDKLLAQEGKRVTQLTMLGATLKVPSEVVQLSIAAGDTVIDAKAKFLSHLQKTAKPVAVDGGAAINVGEDRKKTMLNAALSDAIRIRAGVSVAKPHEEAPRLASLSLIDMSRHYFAAHGVDVTYMSRAKLAELITSRRARASLAQSTSDFDNILMDASNKTLRQAYDEVKTTWQLWARRSTNPDFKPGNRIQLSEIGLPVERKEGGEIKYNTVTDGKEQVTLTEYVTGIKLTNRAVQNDDLDAFARFPTQMGQAFRRLEDIIAYGILTANATLATTGGALFNSTAVTTAAGHGNLISSGGGAPSVTTLAATSALMRKQVGMKKVTGDQGQAYLNLQPKTLIVPVALEVVAAQLVGSSVDPSKSNAAINPYFNGLNVVSHPVLDATSAVAWYLSADPNTIDTVEVCFLQDEPAPVLKNETQFDTDDVKFAGRHTITAKAIDYRGLAKNPGQ